MTDDLFTRLARRAIALQVDDMRTTAGEDPETLAFDRRVEATGVEGDAPAPPVAGPANPEPPRYWPEAGPFPLPAPVASSTSAGHPAQEDSIHQRRTVPLPRHPSGTPDPSPQPGHAVPGPGPVQGLDRQCLSSGEHVQEAPEPTLRAQRADVTPQRSGRASPAPALRPRAEPGIPADRPREHSVPEATAPIPADITIGRLEIRVRPPSGTASKGAAERYPPSSQAVSLADYLRQREGGAK